MRKCTVGLVRVGLACLVGWMVGLYAAGVQAEEKSTPAPLTWHTDYVQAMKLAREEGKMLFVFFHNPEGDKAKQMFEERSLADEQVTKALGSFVVAKVPV